MKAKSYLLDATVSVLFWTPIVAVTSYIIGLDVLQIGYVSLTSAVNNMAFGAPFGRVLNGWRRKLNYH